MKQKIDISYLAELLDEYADEEFIITIPILEESNAEETV